MSQKTYQLAPNLQICRILNGMWQVAGGHGQIDRESAVSEMMLYHDSDFTTWDMADIYGPAEEYLGEFRKRLAKKKGESELDKIQALTKFVPNSGPMTRSIVEHYIDRSIRRMNVKTIDVVQFHWWDYSDTSYLDALHHLSKIRDDGKIRHIGLTNFDTERIEIMVENGFKMVSNQVQYSILDQRPEVMMAPFCQKHGIKLLTYGTLLGGFLSESYLGKPEPAKSQLYTFSLQKYKNMIDAWGGWILFQELLATLDSVAKKHHVGIANVATKYILDKPAVAGVIIGARLGIAEHRSENARAFSLNLDKEDNEKITSVTSKSQDLFSSIGDCGSEYR
ncbi:aldo/keto reductase [Candidatus Nitrosotenuis sp. DW1]|uniref:aldo/keto reductase n=1 Tax=Candidatus Nitrosotenuis sp. DW1 TaxID=2259672 RepID=UPI0015C6FAA0|nr:aldo/keto reductase [Candidatus Nitrosotenuis sp. DW1]QLH09228.1 aldo/keto reductase [Candidatus Nitrosotenuis sp. DW1]